MIMTLPLAANEADDEIIKNLDFFQNMELIKDENPYSIKNSILLNTSNDHLFIHQEPSQQTSFPDSEKK